MGINFNVEMMRIWYCMSEVQYREVTGFNANGGYAHDKFVAFNNNMAMELCSYDINVLSSLVVYARDKL
jgi:hypothetical protein